ncbi:MAG: hypothetical protein EB117_12890, partial [Betaproteobacteria bacterium]|nr:hypothetical protein [Betaproteobacteria bacterium]
MSKEVKEAKDFWTKATGKPIGMTDKEIEQFIKDNPEDFNLKLLAVADRLQSAPTPATSGAGTTTGVTGADTITGAAGNDAVKPTTPPPTSSLLSGVDKYINPISGKDETQLLKQLLDKQLKEQGITNLDQLSLENISEGFEDFVNSPQTRTALINKTTGAEVNPVLFDDGYGTKFVVTPNGIEKQFVAAEKVAKQAASILDPNSTGGAWTTQAGKSSGPGFGTQGMLNQIGQRIVEITGITDLSQLGARQVPVEGYYRTVSGGEGGDVSEYVPASTKTEFFDKETGQTIDWDGSLGTWGQGPGTTYGNVTADAEGKLKVQTLGDDSTDPFIKAVAKAGPVLNIANVLTGGALTPLTLAVNSINAIANENPFAIAASFAGLGGYTGLIDTATASAIQVGANAANAVKEGNLLGALATIAGSSVGQGIGTVELGNGITVTDALNAASAVDKAVKGDIAGALADAGKAANSTELKTAGAALQLVNALESGNLNAIANAAQGLYSGVNNLVTQSQVGQLLVDSAGIGAIDADLGGDLLGTGALSTLKTDTVTGGLSGAADTAGGGNVVDEYNVVSGGLPTSVNPAEDAQIAQQQRITAANQALADYLGPGNDLSREGLVSQLQGLGFSAADSENYAKQADAQINQQRVGADVMNRYSRIDPEFGTPALDRQAAVTEMVAAGFSKERANELLNGIDAQNAIKLENKLSVQSAYQNFVGGKGSEEALRSAMTSAGYTDKEIENQVLRGRAYLEGSKLTAGEQAQQRGELLPDIRAEAAAKPTFAEAYALVRDKLGPGATFTWQGKEYVASSAAERPDLVAAQTPAATATAATTTGTASTETPAEAAGQTITVNGPAGRTFTVKLPLSQQQVTDKNATGMLYNRDQTLNEIGTALSNQMKVSSQAAQDYLKNNPNSPWTQAVSTAYEAAGTTMRDLIGGSVLALGNKDAAFSIIKGGEDLINLGQSIGTGPQDTANWNNTIRLVDSVSDPMAKIAIVAGRILDGTSGLSRQIEVELRQELPGIFFGATGGVGSALVATGLFDVGETGGAAVIEGYQEAINKGKSHEEALLAGRKRGAAEGLTESGVQLILGKIGHTLFRGVDSITGKAAVRLFGESLEEAGQEGLGALAGDLAVGNAPNVNKALTQAVLGGFTGLGTATTTAPVTSALDISEQIDELKSTGIDATASVKTVIESNLNQALTSGQSIDSAVSNTVVGSINSGADASSVVNLTIDTGIKAGADTATLVSSTVNNALTTGADASAVIQSAVDAGIKSGGDTGTVLQSTVTSAITNGADPNATVTTAINAGLNSQGGVSTVVSSAVSGGLAAGGNASTVVKAAVDTAITATVKSGTSLETASVNAVSSAINGGLTSGGDASSVVGSAVGAAIQASGGNQEVVASVLQTSAAAGVGAGGNVSTVVAATTKAAVDGGVNGATAAVSAVAGVAASGGDVTAAATAASNASGTQVTTSVESGKTVITAISGDTVTRSVVDAASKITLTSVTDLKTNQTSTTITDASTQQDITNLQDSVTQLKTDLTTKIEASIKSGQNADAALQKAIESLASDLGTTKEGLLSQLGTTEAALKKDFASQLTDVSKTLNDAIAASVKAGQDADTALNTSITKVASDLGLTKDQLLDQIGKTEAALKTDVKTLSDTVTKINTDLSTEIKNNLKTTQDANAVLDQSINKVASDLGITKDQLLDQIGKTESQLKTEIQTMQDTITQVKTDLTTQINTLAKTTADADKIITSSIEKVAEDLGLTKKELLDTIGETEASLKAELATELGKVAASLGKEIKGIKTGLASSAAIAAAQPIRGISLDNDWLKGQMLKAGKAESYRNPLAEFQALQEESQKQEMLKQIDPELANVLAERGTPVTPYYSYGEE